MIEYMHICHIIYKYIFYYIIYRYIFLSLYIYTPTQVHIYTYGMCVYLWMPDEARRGRQIP